MRSIVCLSLEAASAVVHAAAARVPVEAASRAAVPREPLFGLPLTIAAMRALTPAPADLLARCPELTNARWKRRLWVLAATQTGDGTVYVLAGRFVPTRAGDVAPGTDQGAVVRLTATTCALLGAAIEPFASPEAFDGELSRTALAALARDVATRYRKAFSATILCRSAEAARTPPSLRQAMAAPSP